MFISKIIAFLILKQISFIIQDTNIKNINFVISCDQLVAQS